MIKRTVDLAGVSPEIAIAYAIVAPIIRDEGVECVITSCKDSHEGKKSRHNVGHAIDIRTRDLPPHRIDPVRDRCADALGPQFDFLFHTDHYHLEFDPKE